MAPNSSANSSNNKAAERSKPDENNNNNNANNNANNANNAVDTVSTGSGGSGHRSRCWGRRGERRRRERRQKRSRCAFLLLNLIGRAWLFLVHGPLCRLVGVRHFHRGMVRPSTIRAQQHHQQRCQRQSQREQERLERAAGLDKTPPKGNDKEKGQPNQIQESPAAAAVAVVVSKSTSMSVSKTESSKLKSNSAMNSAPKASTSTSPKAGTSGTTGPTENSNTSGTSATPGTSGTSGTSDKALPETNPGKSVGKTGKSATVSGKQSASGSSSKESSKSSSNSKESAKKIPYSATIALPKRFPPNANIITHATNGPPRLARSSNASYFLDYHYRPHSSTGSYDSGASGSGGGNGGGNNGRLNVHQNGPPRPASAMSKLSCGGGGGGGSGSAMVVAGTSVQNGESSGSSKAKRPLGSGEVYGKRPEREERFRQMTTGSGKGKRSKSSAKEAAEPEVAVPANAAAAAVAASAADPTAFKFYNEDEQKPGDYCEMDIYGQLADINVHRWIVWLFNHCLLLPHLYLPSERHFTYGSIHDISYQLQLLEDASVGAAGCSSRDIVLHFWKIYVKNNCTSSNAIEPLKVIISNQQLQQQQQALANNSAVMMVAAGSLEMAASPLVDTTGQYASSASSSSKFAGTVRSSNSFPMSALGLLPPSPPTRTPSPTAVTSPASSPPPPPPPYRLPISSVSMATKASTSVVIDMEAAAAARGLGSVATRLTKSTSSGNGRGVGAGAGQAVEMVELKSSVQVESPPLPHPARKEVVVKESVNGGAGNGNGEGDKENPKVMRLRSRLMEAAIRAGRQLQEDAAIAEGGGVVEEVVAVGWYEESSVIHSSTSSFDIRGWFTVRAWVAFCFFLLLSGRQLLHFSYILIASESRQVPFFWAPLVVNTITTLATAFSALWLVGKKYLVEDQMITTASFLRPLRHFWHLFLRGIPRLYFALQVVYQLVNVLGVVLVVMQKDGAWEFANLNGTMLSSSGGGVNGNSSSQNTLFTPITPGTSLVVAGDGLLFFVDDQQQQEKVMMKGVEKAEELVMGKQQSDLVSMSISNWHLFESVWRPSLVVVNNGSSGSNDDDDDHGGCCRKSLARQANAVMRSSEALLSFTGSLAWVFWLDLAFRFISNLILAMMKSIWLSLASFLILKSIHFVVQRDFIIAKGLARNGMNFTCQFQAHVVNATDGNGNGNGNGGGSGNAAQSEIAASRTTSAASTASANSGASTSASGSAASASASSSSCSTTRSSLRSSNGVHSQLSSAEVLRTLSSMQLENLRRFYRIFRVPAVVWVTACLVKLTALLEYLYVGGESFAPWSKESISFGDGTTLSSTLATFLFRWYECVFFGLSLAVTAADIILPATTTTCTPTKSLPS